jgi:hypothetical protein
MNIFVFFKVCQYFADVYETMFSGPRRFFRRNDFCNTGCDQAFFHGNLELTHKVSPRGGVSCIRQSIYLYMLTILSSIILYKDCYLNYSHQLVMCTFESYQLDLIKPGAVSSGMSACFSSKSHSLQE